MSTTALAPILRSALVCAFAGALTSSVAAADAAPDYASLPALVLGACKPTFVEDFKSLSVSAWGPGTRWIAHTPWNGDFGDAAFSDPTPGFPFKTGPEGLTIEARRIDGKWRSGLLSSTDKAGAGFSQTHGYFEFRAKMPPGPGVWPALWLDTREGEPIKVEVDVLEFYGFPDWYQAAIHVWRDGKELSAQVHKVPVPPGVLTSGFHTFGADVEPDYITFYMDRKPVWRVATPVEHKAGLGALINLALGSGYSTEHTPDPSRMMVTYFAAYPSPRTCRGG